MALKNKVIIFLGNTRFDSDIKATSLFIARSLSKDNKVFFIDYPFTLKDYFQHKKSESLKNRKKKFSLFSDGILDTDLPNLKIVITPPVLPINFLPESFLFRSLLKVNESIISRRIKKILRTRKIDQFIYINSFNFHYPNISSYIKPALSVYHCVDPMIVPYDMKHGIISEKQLVEGSDLVICTSRALYEEKKAQNKNTFFVPNGTDLSNNPVVCETEHPKLKSYPKPVVGYLGTIERRIDYELLKEVIEANQDKSFVLVGPVYRNFVPDEYYKFKNVHILGPIPYEEAAQIISSFDIAIIPFKLDEVSKTIFPIKLFEYLSIGKPVVLTDFNPDLKEFTSQELVSYCNNAKSFSMAINNELATNNQVKLELRKKLALENTWDKRAEQIKEIIDSFIK